MSRSSQRVVEHARGIGRGAAPRRARALRTSRAAMISKLLRWSALGGSIGVAILLTSPRVSASAPTAVTIRVATDGDAAFVERIRGQVSDLDVTLQTTRAPSLEPSHAERVSAASDLGRSTSSDIVVWFERLDASVRIYVLSVDSGDVLVRSVNTGAATATSDLRTSTLETVALVVRDAIAAWHKAQLASPAPSKAPELRMVPSVPPTRAQFVTAVPPLPAWAIQSSLGWLTIVSGSSHSTFQGVVVREDLRRGRFGGGLSASTSLPSDVDDGPVRLRLRRLAGSVHGTYGLPIGNYLRLDALAGAGVVVFSRSTEVLTRGASAAPGNDALSPVLTAELMLAVRPWTVGVAQGAGFFVSAGLDYAFRPPRYDYATERGVESGPAIAAVQPRLSIGVAWEIFLHSTARSPR